VVLNFTTPVGASGKIYWSLTGNYARTKVTKIAPTPPQLAASGQSLFDKVALSTLEKASPLYKAILSGVYSNGPWTIAVKETLFGNASRFADPGDGTFYLDETGTALITDIDISYRVLKLLTLSIGANNLFNKRPNLVNQDGLRVAALAEAPRWRSVRTSRRSGSTAAIITCGQALTSREPPTR
jgi:iron complex outermembrane receptor protein